MSESSFPTPQRAYDDAANNLKSRIVDASTALARVQRGSVCTLVLFGAPWDGYYKAFVGRGYWAKLAEELALVSDPKIDLVIFEYDGGIGGIPPSLLPVDTISSYDWHMYRAGRLLWDSPPDSNVVRRCYEYKRDGGVFNTSCILEACNNKASIHAP